MQKLFFITLLVILTIGAFFIVGRTFTASASDPSASSKIKYNHRVWLVKDGLPQHSVRAVLQTSDGYLWVGTSGGLTRFNGFKFQAFGLGTEGLKSNRIVSLYETKDQTLWIITEDGGLSQFKQERFKTLSRQDGLPDGNVLSIYEDRKGNIWIGTDKGLTRQKDGKSFTYTTDNGLPDSNVKCVLEDRNGDLWVGTEEGLARLRDERFTTYTEKDGLTNIPITSLLEDRDGNLWVGTTYSLYRSRGGNFTRYTTKQGLANDEVITLYQDSNGNIWVGTAKGLNRLKDEVFTTYNTTTGLSDDKIHSLFEDNEKNLWIGTDVGGLNRFRDGKVTAFGEEEGLPSTSAIPIFEDKDGALWIGTNCGGLVKYQAGKFTTYTAKDGLPNPCVWSLNQDREGNLLVGTWDSGFARFKDGRFTSYSLKEGLSSNVVLSIYEDRSGVIWAGTVNGLNRFKDGVFTVYQTKDGLVNDRVHFITEDRQGSLLIGTEGGFSKFKDGKFINYTVNEGLSNNYVRDILEDPDGTLWIGTYGGGLNRFKDGKFIHYSTSVGLYDDIVSRILEDDYSNFWMSGNKGIHKASRKELNDFAEGKIHAITNAHYGVVDGMNINECNGGGQPSGWKTRDGKLWFPTIKGVVAVNPKNINPMPPPVIIEQVVVDKKPIPFQSNVELSPGQGDLEFHYTGLSLATPEKVRFKYKLEGFDNDWVDADTRRVAFYTNIPPGQYNFRVIACNDDNIWNETGATFGFYLKPYFYQTYSFYTLCAGVVVLLGIGLHRLRVRQLKSRQKELTLLVEERTRAEAALRENRRRLEDALHKLNAAQQQIIQQERLRALGQMASGIAHDFNNSLAPILGYAELLLKFPKNMDDKVKLTNDLHLISTAAKDAAKTVSRLREFYRTPEEDEPFVRVNLNQLIEQTILLTQPKWKNQAQIEGTTIFVKTDVKDELFAVCNESALREAMMNLIFNAVDAMPEGGTITIRAKAENELFILEISDTGTGMTEEVCQRCLEPFFSTKGARGTGLGLAMVYGIMQRHKGTVEIETKSGYGTTVRLSFPSLSEQKKEKDFQPEAMPLSHSLRVLVVDDEPEMRQILAQFLIGNGHRVETATNGREGLEKFRAGSFDLIVTDRAMPEISGDRMSAAIKEINPAIPIILVTGFADYIGVTGEHIEGIDLIVNKPATLDDLRKAVAKVSSR